MARLDLAVLTNLGAQLAASADEPAGLALCRLGQNDFDAILVDSIDQGEPVFIAQGEQL